MATARLNRSERWARALVVLVLAGVVLGVGWAWLHQRRAAVEVHARMPERGGFLPDSLTVRVGEPVRLRLVSDDVLHGFAVGQTDFPEVVLYPGQVVEVTLRFDRPGRYTYFCTRWCGPNHWRMRGTIVVEGDVPAEAPTATVEPPLYLQLGLDLDAPHEADIVPARRPSAVRGAALKVTPAVLPDEAALRRMAPVELWRQLRRDPALAALTDQQVWDLVAWLWQRPMSTERLTEGAALYRRDCAACHGATGRGDGVFAPRPPAAEAAEGLSGHHVTAPPDFTDPAELLGASPALLQGKILRGGMGTGMPSWGLIYTEEQTWALVDYLWTFVMDFELAPDAGPTTR